MRCNDKVSSFSSSYGFRITGVVSDNIREAHFGDWHYDEAPVLAFFKRASGEVKVEGNSYTVSDGDLLILNYNEIHSVDLKAAWGERISLYLDEKLFDGFHPQVKSLLSPFCDRNLGTQNLLCSRDVSRLKIDSLLEEALLEMSKQNAVSELMAFTAVIRILSALYEIFSSDREPDNAHFSSPIIKETLQYIKANYCNNISLDSISREMAISKYYLSRLFKETVGVSLWDYIIKRRLFHFNELVKNGASIQNAAIDSGFNNYANFYRLYKKNMHISPIDFKNKTVNLQ